MSGQKERLYDVLTMLNRHIESLTEWERDYVRRVSNRFDKHLVLSGKQVDKIYEIYKSRLS